MSATNVGRRLKLLGTACVLLGLVMAIRAWDGNDSDGVFLWGGTLLAGLVLFVAGRFRET